MPMNVLWDSLGLAEMLLFSALPDCPGAFAVTQTRFPHIHKAPTKWGVDGGEGTKRLDPEAKAGSNSRLA